MALFKPYPVVSFGSLGEAVLLLQKALNLGPTQLARLAEDASFGPKTHGRVVEFQGQKHAARDGVVGPVTWSELEPFVQQVLKMVDQNLGPSGGRGNAATAHRRCCPGLVREKPAPQVFRLARCDRGSAEGGHRRLRSAAEPPLPRGRGCRTG